MQNGTDAILTLGTTGESATMTDDEDNSVVAAVVKHVAGRVPVIAGSGSNSTQTMLTKSLTTRAWEPTACCSLPLLQQVQRRGYLSAL
ncbi:MAG: dihydrodipicolinate synthase family protein [Collinsella sp.]